LGIATVALTVSPFIALVPSMAIDVLHAGKIGTSWLVTAQGVGAVIGALTLPALARRTSRLYVLRGALITAAVAEVLYGLAPDLGWAIAALVVLGGAYVGILTGLNTSVQLHAPVSERARILSLYTLSLSLAYPVGALIQSAFARTYGVRVVSVVGATALLVVLAAVSLLGPSVWGEIAAAPPGPARLLAD
jgi:predicted MFS family arabinose efflux permease